MMSKRAWIRVGLALSLGTLFACTKSEDLTGRGRRAPRTTTVDVTFEYPDADAREQTSGVHVWVLGTANPDIGCGDFATGMADPYDVDFVVRADVVGVEMERDMLSTEAEPGAALVYAEAVDYRGTPILAGCSPAEIVAPSTSVTITFRPTGVADCSDPSIEDGTPCDDGMLCTVGESCQGGSCTGGAPRDCTQVADDCNAESCQEDVGCVAVPLSDGRACEDGLACTTGDSCMMGVCVAGSMAGCCPGPECLEFDCANFADDDLDGLTDCADPDCVADPACAVVEDCANGFDDDGDGLTDCDDADCAPAPICQGCPDTCPDRTLGSALGASVATGTTSSSCNNRVPSCRTSSDAPEQTFLWIAPSSGTYRFDLDNSSYDTVMYLLSSCGGAELPGACDDDGGSTSLASRVDIDLTAGQQLVIVVDGYGSSSGMFILNITRVVAQETGLCGDGVDNDNDGLTDCQDSDCAGDAACAENCSNGVDDNGNGLVDCFDSQCTGMAPCIEVCDDMVDNDVDGQTDCNDTDCFAALVCQPEDCGNAADDNGNGLVDCDELSCASSADCGEARMCGDLTDNDGDGLSDCSDAECACSASCGGPSCPGQDLGTTLGTFNGTTAGACNTGHGSCDPNSAAPDVTLLWTAPAAATYTFSTTGSSFASTVYLLGGGDCEGAELACDTGAISSVSRAMAMGEQVAIVIDGQMDQSGTYELIIQ